MKQSASKNQSCIHRMMMTILLGNLINISILAAEPLTIRVGIYDNPPKVYIRENNQVAGFFPDILNHVALQEGWQLEFIYGTWQEALDRLAAAELDVMVDMAYSEERAALYDFSENSVFVNWGTIYTRQGFVANTLFELGSHSIAVMKGSIHTEGAQGIRALLHKFEIPVDFVEVNDYRTVFQLLLEGQVDAGVVNRLFGETSEMSLNLNKSTIIFNPRHLKFAFPKNAPLTEMIRERLDIRLAAMKADPNSIFYQLIDHYLSQNPGEFGYSGTSESLWPILTEAEQEWILSHPHIKVGIDPAWPPFEWFDEQGHPQGFSSDYIQLLSSRLGLNMEIIPGLTWMQVLDAVQATEIDAVACVAATDLREDYLSFTEPYLTYPIVILTRSDEPNVSNLHDLTGRSVGVVRGYAYHETLRQDYPGILLMPVESSYSGLHLLSTGGIDAYVGNLAVSTYLIQKHQFTNLKVAASAEDVASNELALGVRKDWPILVNILNKGLNSITSAERNAIASKWLAVRYEHAFDWRRVIKIIAGVVIGSSIILLIFLSWNRKLAHEIAFRKRVERDLVEARDAAQSADKLKSAFLATMSHELRTPLNSIIGFTGILLQKLAGPLTDEQSKQLKMVQGSSRHLLALINDVLDISKIEAGQFQLTCDVFDMRQSLSIVCRSVMPLAEQKGLVFSLEIAPGVGRVKNDQRRVEQVVLNLLSNAIKFTERGEIRVRCFNQDDQVCTVISDTGIGIKSEDLNKLFHPFQQVDSGLTRQHDGTGLGLSISKRLVELMGGTVSVKSVFGIGSTFQFSLPLQDEDYS